MDVQRRGSSSSGTQSEEEMDLRRGPWTMEEDLILVNYIANHGEGRWNSLARCSGLKRTGKSCRLRWLNYLRPDVRRGNITAEEQLLILELHSRWGNRWSKIAQHLPGRTDNEIKNYWRTRVQKHAKQLKCDVNSKQFKDAMRYIWMPHLMQRIRAAAAAASSGSDHNAGTHPNPPAGQPLPSGISFGAGQVKPSITPENSSTDSLATANSHVISPVSDYNNDYYFHGNNTEFQTAPLPCSESLPSPSGFFCHGFDFPVTEQEQQQNGWFGGDLLENTWNLEDFWFLPQQQLC